jgi:hypothetical protein
MLDGAISCMIKRKEIIAFSTKKYEYMVATHEEKKQYGCNDNVYGSSLSRDL